MKIEIVMQYDAAFEEIGAVSVPNVQAYAKKHGYDLRVFRDMPLSCPYWSKVWRMRQRRDESRADYLFWLDTDALVLDFGVALEDIRCGLIMDVPQDAYGICTGAFGFLRSYPASQILDTWMFLGELENPHQIGLPGETRDQATLMLMERNFPEVRNYIGRIPETLIANEGRTVSATLPFIYLFWTRGKDKSQVVKAMQDKLKEVRS